ERAVRCVGDLARGDLPAILERSSFYPPLVLCAAGLAYRLAPSDVAAAQSVVLAFLGLGTGAVYVLARRFAGATEGVVAALVFATAPFVVFSSLRFQLDLPLASMVALMLVVLLRTDTFEHRRWLLLASVLPAFALFELLQNKNLRYTLPLLPVAAVLAGLGFGALPARLRDGGRVLLIVAGVVQVSATVFGVPHVSVPLLDVP